MSDHAALRRWQRAPSRARGTLRQSNDTVAARLVHKPRGSYARALSSDRVWKRGGEEGPRCKHAPNNYINDPKKKNWAAFARPIFLHLPIGIAGGSQ